MTAPMRASGATREQYGCPAWCAVDHEALVEHEALVQWRVHESAAAAVVTHLGDRAAVEVLAGDDMQTGERGAPGIRLVVDSDAELPPTDALRLAAALMAAAALAAEGRVSE